MKAEWQSEKDAIDAIGDVKERLDAGAPRGRARRARGRPRARRRAPLRRDPRAREPRSPRPSCPGAPATARFFKEEVDEEDVAEVVAKWTGIPVARLMEGEVEKLDPHGGAPARARRRPGRGGRGGLERGAPLARRAPGPEPADRLVPLPRARPASARPSWRARSRSSCSTPSRRWCASTCRSTWRSTPSPGWSARRPATSATRRAAS